MIHAVLCLRGCLLWSHTCPHGAKTKHHATSRVVLERSTPLEYEEYALPHIQVPSNVWNVRFLPHIVTRCRCRSFILPPLVLGSSCFPCRGIGCPNETVLQRKPWLFISASQQTLVSTHLSSILYHPTLCVLTATWCWENHIRLHPVATGCVAPARKSFCKSSFCSVTYTYTDW